MLNKSKIVVLTLIALMGLSLFLVSGALAKNNKDITIVLVPKSTTNPYWKAVQAGVKKAGKEFGIDARFVGPTKNDVMLQIPIIEDLINKKVDAIAISPNDSKAIEPVIEEGMKAGIPMFTFDSDASESQRIAYIAGANDVEIGKLVIDTIAKYTDNSGKIAILTGGLGAEGANLRIKGMKAQVKAKYPDIQIITVQANDDDPNKAYTQALNVLRAHPDLAAFACTTSVGVPAAGKAVKSLGQEDKVYVVGLGTPNQNRSLVKDGAVTALTIWDPTQLGYETVKNIYEYLTQGKELSGVLIPGEIKVMDKDNIDQYNF